MFTSGIVGGHSSPYHPHHSEGQYAQATPREHRHLQAKRTRGRLVLPNSRWAPEAILHCVLGRGTYVYIVVDHPLTENTANNTRRHAKHGEDFRVAQAAANIDLFEPRLEKTYGSVEERPCRYFHA